MTPYKRQIAKALATVHEQMKDETMEILNPILHNLGFSTPITRWDDDGETTHLIISVNTVLSIWIRDDNVVTIEYYGTTTECECSHIKQTLTKMVA